jgi:polygalacturonase
MSCVILREVAVRSRFFVFELENAAFFEMQDPYRIFLDGVFIRQSRHVVDTIYDLLPQTSYSITIVLFDGTTLSYSFTTEKETVTLDVRKFGAKGDGVHDDTPAIQAAIACCPAGGRVWIPYGVYHTGSIFLKSGLFLDIDAGARISAFTDREKFPLLPGCVERTDGKGDCLFASWEGNPLDCFASIFTGIGVSHVTISGQGIVDGNAGFDNWWKNDGRIKTDGGFRPRLVFLNRCSDVLVQGLTFQNSPAWNLHPYFSDHTQWVNLTVRNPKVSPNTDGIDPESVDDLTILGCDFSLGDDCVAIKSGKYYMGDTYHVPSQNIEIRHCRMENGHGAVTIGSEMAAGVHDVHVTECEFLHTDRGLRIKTRRGRGKAAVIDNIHFEYIRMEGVLTPFVVNSFYWCCDPDGHSTYVSSKTPLPVDDRTPSVRNLEFNDIRAENCEVAACFIYGLPEAKIEQISMRHISILFSDDAKPMYPAMMADLSPCAKKGIFIANVRDLLLEDINVTGQEGPIMELQGIDHKEMDTCEQQ